MCGCKFPMSLNSQMYYNQHVPGLLSECMPGRNYHSAMKTESISVLLTSGRFFFAFELKILAKMDRDVFIYLRQSEPFVDADCGFLPQTRKHQPSVQYASCQSLHQLLWMCLSDPHQHLGRKEIHSWTKSCCIVVTFSGAMIPYTWNWLILNQTTGLPRSVFLLLIDSRSPGFQRRLSALPDNIWNWTQNLFNAKHVFGHWLLCLTFLKDSQYSWSLLQTLSGRSLLYVTWYVVSAILTFSGNNIACCSQLSPCKLRWEPSANQIQHYLHWSTLIHSPLFYFPSSWTCFLLLRAKLHMTATDLCL